MHEIYWESLTGSFPAGLGFGVNCALVATIVSINKIMKSLISLNIFSLSCFFKISLLYFDNDKHCIKTKVFIF